MADHGIHLTPPDGKGALIIYISTGAAWLFAKAGYWFGFLDVHWVGFEIIREIAPVFTVAASCCAIYTFIKNMVKKK